MCPDTCSPTDTSGRSLADEEPQGCPALLCFAPQIRRGRSPPALARPLQHSLQNIRALRSLGWRSRWPGEVPAIHPPNPLLSWLRLRSGLLSSRTNPGRRPSPSVLGGSARFVGL